MPSLNEPIHRARVLATMLALAQKDGTVDLEAAEPLWEIGVQEDDLWELGQQGVIHFDSVGEDGFKPIVLCSVTTKTKEHLLAAIKDAADQSAVLQARLDGVLRHNPEKLLADISNSETHIRGAREHIRSNPLLHPLNAPLDEIAKHFSSIKNVAKNYDDVYNNVLKPMQDEGRRGVRATVKWALIGIASSWLIANYNALVALTRGALGSP